MNPIEKLSGNGATPPPVTPVKRPQSLGGDIPNVPTLTPEVEAGTAAPIPARPPLPPPPPVDNPTPPPVDNPTPADDVFLETPLTKEDLSPDALVDPVGTVDAAPPASPPQEGVPFRGADYLAQPGAPIPEQQRGELPAQNLINAVGADVSRTMQSDERFYQRSKLAVEGATQQSIYPALYEAPSLATAAAGLNDDWQLTLADLNRREALRQQQQTAANSPQMEAWARQALQQVRAIPGGSTNPLEGLLGWASRTFTQGGNRQYINIVGQNADGTYNSNIGGAVMYGLSLPWNSVVGAGLDARNFVSNAYNNFVPPWMRNSSVLKGIDAVTQYTPFNVIAQWATGSNRLNDSKSNFVEAIRGAQYSFGDDAGTGVGIKQNIGVNVNLRDAVNTLSANNPLVVGLTSKHLGAKSPSIDVNPTALLGFGLDVFLGAKVDKAINAVGRRAGFVSAKTLKAEARAAQDALRQTQRAKDVAAVAEARAKPPVQYIQPSLPFLPSVPTIKKPPTIEQANAVRAAKKASADFEKRGRVQARRLNNERRARERLYSSDEQQVLNVEGFQPVYRAQREARDRSFGGGVKLKPGENARQLELALNVNRNPKPKVASVPKNKTPQFTDEQRVLNVDGFTEKAKAQAVADENAFEVYRVVLRKGENSRQLSLDKALDVQTSPAPPKALTPRTRNITTKPDKNQLELPWGDSAKAAKQQARLYREAQLRGDFGQDGRVLLRPNENSRQTVIKYSYDEPKPAPPPQKKPPVFERPTEEIRDTFSETPLGQYLEIQAPDGTISATGVVARRGRSALLADAGTLRPSRKHINIIEAVAGDLDVPKPIAKHIERILDNDGTADLPKILRQVDEHLPSIRSTDAVTQKAADVVNETLKGKVIHRVLANADAAMEGALKATEDTADVGRKFVHDWPQRPLPLTPLAPIELPTKPAARKLWHGTRVEGHDLTKADPLVGGGRNELGVGHYLTSNKSVAMDAARADVAPNLPPIEERNFGSPSLISASLDNGATLVDARKTSEGMTRIAKHVAAQFPEIPVAWEGKMSLTQVLDYASKHLDEGLDREFQRHLSTTLQQMGYDGVKAGSTQTLFDGARITSQRSRPVLDDAASPLASKASRTRLDTAVARELPESTIAAANAADAKAGEAVQAVHDLAEVQKAQEHVILKTTEQAGMWDEITIENVQQWADDMPRVSSKDSHIDDFGWDVAEAFDGEVDWVDGIPYVKGTTEPAVPRNVTTRGSDLVDKAPKTQEGKEATALKWPDYTEDVLKTTSDDTRKVAEFIRSKATGKVSDEVILKELSELTPERLRAVQSELTQKGIGGSTKNSTLVKAYETRTEYVQDALKELYATDLSKVRSAKALDALDAKISKLEDELKTSLGKGPCSL